MIGSSVMVLRADQVRVVSLDAGGTLLFPHPSVGEVYSEILSRHGIDLRPDEIEVRFRRVFSNLRGIPRNRVDDAAERAFWERLVREVLSPECPPDRFADVFIELFGAFAEGRRWRVAEEGEDLVRRLRGRGIRVVLLSNSDIRLRRVLREKGLIDLFDEVFISAEIGFEKPDIRLFRTVEERLQERKEALLHVGDSVYHDLEGARNAGWQALHLAGEFRPSEDKIARLTDLRLLLG
jgi:REG-2-like HAD superfamily hydrolase